MKRLYNEGIDYDDYFDCDYEEIKIDKFIKICTVNEKLIISKRLSKILGFTKRSKTLRTLAITQCAIGDEGAAIISDCSAHNTSIRELELSHNLITNKGAIKIFKSTEFNSVLQSLNMLCNKISDDGALAARECLKNNSTLLKLNIARNDIKDDGIIAICDCLKSNATLQHLSMPFSYLIGDKVASKFSKSLAENKALNTLTIDCLFCFYNCFIILSAMYDNHTIVTLTLTIEHSNFSTSERYALQTEVEEISIIRRSQNIDTLDVIFLDKMYHPVFYQTKL